MHRALTAAAILLAAAGTARAQLAINEVFENPPNGGDQTWEYIEIYGPPNYKLNGYAVVLVKGGEDNNPQDEIPDGALHQKTAEIDEAFSLDGWTTDANGLFVIYNVGQFNSTGLSTFLTPNPGFQFVMPESPTNKRFLNGASFVSLYIPSVFDADEIAGKLENEGSSTYLLVRRRPNHALATTGLSSYLPGYVWAKDTCPDVDFNSRLDLGDEHALGLPLYFSEGSEGNQTTAGVLNPVQIIDEVSWSNGGGKEYNSPSRDGLSGKFSQTPGFNPDMIVRVRYFGAAPTLGWAIDEDTNIVKQRNAADESWLYGEAYNVNPGTSNYGRFKPGPVDTAAPTELVWLAPTNVAGNKYSFVTGDTDNPFVAPFFAESPSLDPNGDLLVEPYNIAGVRVTPGTFNDAQAGTQLIGTPIAQQFRWVRGDFNFDRTVDCADRALIVQAAAEQWRLDDQISITDDRNTLSTADDVTYMGYRWRLNEYNGLLAMLRMNLTDGSTGDWTSGQSIDSTPGSPSNGKIVSWGGIVTPQDLAAFTSEFPALTESACEPAPSCPGDFNGSLTVNADDIFAFLDTWFAQNGSSGAMLSADVNGSGGVNADDIFAYLDLWFANNGNVCN